MSIENYGPEIIAAGGFQVRNGVRYFSGSGFPKSGTAGTGITRNGRGAPTGSIYVDKLSGVAFTNEGSVTSPYWSPVSFDQRGLLGWHGDFRDGTGKALADTAATATLVGTGLRIHGQGIEVNGDSGLTVVYTATDGKGPVGVLATTDEDAHLSVISVGTGTTPVFQPDQNGTMVVDTLVTNVGDLLAKAIFCGFCGSAANALDPIMTYTGTTISFAATVGDDVAGLAFSSELTAASTWFAPHDKGNANASIATTATGVNTGVTVAAAGTYQRLRVECDADGTVRTFIDKVLTSTHAAALDTDEEMQPMVYLESSTTTAITMNLRHFSAWGKRA